jgi:Ca2+-binding EF-hand superfamily protein
MKTNLLIAFLASMGMAVAAPQAANGAAGSFPEWLDTDGDGVISELERQAFAESRRAVVGSLQEQWDTNGDGVIDAEERAKAITDLKAKALSKIKELFLIAAGGDGVLTPDEFAAIAPADMPAETIDALFKMLDRNADGLVTLDEFLLVAAAGGAVSGPPPPPAAP